MNAVSHLKEGENHGGWSGQGKLAEVSGIFKDRGKLTGKVEQSSSRNQGTTEGTGL